MIGTIIKISAPDDHFTAGPHCRVKLSANWRADSAGGCPTIGDRIVPSASVQIAAVVSAPDDHLTAGQHCRVKLSASGRARGARGCPTSVPGLYLPPVLKKLEPNPPQTIISLPVHTVV